MDDWRYFRLIRSRRNTRVWHHCACADPDRTHVAGYCRLAISAVHPVADVPLLGAFDALGRFCSLSPGLGVKLSTTSLPGPLFSPR
jgi:hypothetical protein